MYKRMAAASLSAMLLTAALTGCTEKDAGRQEADSGVEDIVELDFYISNSLVNDQKRIMEKANEIIEDKIGARLNLITVEGSVYAEKMNRLISSGSDWDLCFTANASGFNFYENAAEGVFADLTDLLPEYAPDTYGRIPEGLWEGVKVNDRIYASVNYQQWGVTAMRGFRVRRDIAQELDFDWKALKGKPTLEAMRMMEPFLQEALEKHTDMIGWETSASNSLFADEPLFWDMEGVGDVSVPGWICLEEPYTVVNQFETEEFAQFCKIMRDWYEKGYVRKDGATLKRQYEYRTDARYVAEVAKGWPDSVDFPEGMEVEAMSMCFVENAPAAMVSNTRKIIPAGAASSAAVAVNAQSRNIEKAVELIELLNTDDELYLLLSQGEEGVDYYYDEDGYYHFVEGKYSFNYSEWQLGQSYSPGFTRALYSRNEDGEIRKQAQKIVFDADKEVKISPLTGFAFDSSPVKMEIVGCTQVIKELLPALSAGSVDPAEILPRFLEQLRKEGADTIIAEKQRQLDAWLLEKQVR